MCRLAVGRPLQISSEAQGGRRARAGLRSRSSCFIELAAASETERLAPRPHMRPRADECQWEDFLQWVLVRQFPLAS